MASILVINGPNLNLLGQREPETYGSTTLKQITENLQLQAENSGHTLQHFQANAEHELINKIHMSSDSQINFIIINAAAFTHTSVAIRDALLSVSVPYIEVHLSNIFAREEFRHQSLLADKALGVIAGFGAQSYYLALAAAIKHLES